MKQIPYLQIALDYVTLPTAIAMAVKTTAHVDVIEIGTPLIKAVGMESVRSIREVCPDRLILADSKTPDVGGLEAKIAFDAGANFVTVMGAAPMDTVVLALEEARRQKKEVLIELTGIRNIMERAAEWKNAGAERIVYHRGWDEGENRDWDEHDHKIIRGLADMGYKVSVAGGITLKLLPFFKDLPISIVVVGREIREAADPGAAALKVRQEIARLWG